jgi:hypothetical protein
VRVADPMMPSLPLPEGAGVTFWRDEVERADRAAKVFHPEWDENVQWYTGKSPDAQAMVGKNADFVNVNVDFYQVEQKQATLFYETPDLQLSLRGTLMGSPQPGMPPQPMPPPLASAVTKAHRELMNAILGDDHIDVLTTVELATKDCLGVSGTGPVIVGYQPTIRDVPAPVQPGQILGLNQSVPVPIHERWFADYFSPKKFLRPADFHSTDWDKAPWLGMRGRMPLAVARREFPTLPLDFTGTTTRDEYVLDKDGRPQEATSQPYLDFVLIWYRAAAFEDAHPELFRELILVDGVDEPVRHRDSPHQTLLPNGRLSGDSLIGNPIAPLTIRSVPDSAYVPADSQMTRPLVRELCKFRTQMVQEREANRSRVLYDTEKMPPEVIARIEDGSLGSLIGVEGGALAGGINAIMAEVVKSSPGRQAYIANDYIQRDIEKTLAIGPAQAGVSDPNESSATQSAIVDRAAQTRQGREQRQVLRWYLKLVDKVSSLVCRYMTPQFAAEYIGQEAAMAWGMWDKKASAARIVFKAKPDSQIRLDAAAERKFWLDTYQFTANDPNVIRTEIVKKVFEKGGEDPSKFVVDQLPEKKPDPPKLALSFKSENLNPLMPEYANVYQVLTQLGIKNLASPELDPVTADLLQKTMQAEADAQTEHGGPAEKQRPLSKAKGEQSGERAGPKV